MAHMLWDILGPGIYIENPTGDLEFTSQVRMSLNIIRSREVGVRLLKGITDACEQKGNAVVIVKAVLCTAAYTQDISEGFIDRLRQPQTKYLCDGALPLTHDPQKGCSGIAYWSPSNKIMGTNETRPAFLPLAHELIHCLHYVSGDCARPPVYKGNWDEDSGLAEEEARTIGLGEYKYPGKSLGPCENEFREAFGMEARTEYVAGKTLSCAKRTHG